MDGISNRDTTVEQLLKIVTKGAVQLQGFLRNYVIFASRNYGHI